MAGFGRGRGRALPESGPSIRKIIRPGESSLVWDIVTAIDCVEVNEREPPSANPIVVMMADKLKETCTTSDIMEMVIQSLHHYCLQNINFAKKCAAVLGEASLFVVDGSKLRTVLLARLQQDFVDHEKILRRDPVKFMNMAYFMGQVFEQVRLKCGTQIEVLVRPNITYLSILLEGRERQLEIFTYLMLLNGHGLREFSEMEFQVLLDKVRRTLAEHEMEPTLRTCLMLVLEFSNYSFKDVPEYILKYYISSIKYSSILKFIKPKDFEFNANGSREAKEDKVSSSGNKIRFVNSHDDRHEVSYEKVKLSVNKKI